LLSIKNLILQKNTGVEEIETEKAKQDGSLKSFGLVSEVLGKNRFALIVTQNKNRVVHRAVGFL
jgi:hypothetical protein